ncbi:MAG: DUF4340 domain-containing protein [Bradymonadia bacterium]
MQKLNNILGILIAAQAILVAITWTTSGGASAPPGAQAIVDGSIDDVTALTIVGQPEEATDGARPSDEPPEVPSVTLTRQGEGWIISSAGDYPAKADKVNDVVSKLTDLQVRRPIATRKGNHEALKVDEVGYSKKVTVTVKGEQKTFYVGPGAANTIHVRRADSDDVYRANGVSEWSIGATPRTYLDTTYVSVDKDRLESIAVTNAKGSFKLLKVNGQWTLEGAPEGAALDETKVNSLVSGVSKVYLNTPVSKEEKPEFGLGQGADVTLIYTEGDGEAATQKTAHYRVGVEKGKSAYMYVKADDRDYVVLASKYAVEAALLRGSADLVAPPKAPGAP